jgi:hypothetical protein
MKTIMLWLVVVGILLIAFAVYRSHASRSRLQVDPQAAEEIEKAKRR